MAANSKNNLIGGGDALARGARSAKFFLGAKKGGKIQINPGILMSEADFKKAEKETPAPKPIDAPVMKRTARPLYDRILVRKATVEEVSKGGIIMPGDAVERPREGTVIRVGKGKRDINGILWELDVKVGDKVLFGQYAGTELKIDGEVLLMLREEEVLCTIEN